VADWGGGMSPGCKPRVQLFVDDATDGRIVRFGSCQSAAVSKTIICKALLVTSLSHVKSAF